MLETILQDYWTRNTEKKVLCERDDEQEAHIEMLQDTLKEVEETLSSKMMNFMGPVISDIMGPAPPTPECEVHEPYKGPLTSVDIIIDRLPLFFSYSTGGKLATTSGHVNRT